MAMAKTTAKAASYIASPASGRCHAWTLESADTASLISSANSFCYVTANLWSWCVLSVYQFIDMIGSSCTCLDAECPLPFASPPCYVGRIQKPSTIAHSGILYSIPVSTIIKQSQKTDPLPPSLSLSPHTTESIIIYPPFSIIKRTRSRPWAFPIPQTGTRVAVPNNTTDSVSVSHPRIF